MNRLALGRRAAILGMMVEGVSIRAISRVRGASKNTIVKLLAGAGKCLLRVSGSRIRQSALQRLQADEIWSFVYAKQKNLPQEMPGQFGLVEGLDVDGALR